MHYEWQIQTGECREELQNKRVDESMAYRQEKMYDTDLTHVSPMVRGYKSQLTKLKKFNAVKEWIENVSE